MELILIRHGQPAWSVDGWSQADPHLTELGRRQSEAMADRIAARRRPVTEIIVSPATRSQETAAPLVDRTGLVPSTEADLTELRLPDWTGEPEEKVQRIFSEARHRSPEEWWEGLDGGESFRGFHLRVTRALSHILGDRGVVPDGRPHLWRDNGADHRIAIVAHAGTNSVLMTSLLGVEPTPWEWERFVLAHASIARVRTTPLAGAHVFSLRAFNDQEHLPVDSRST